MGNEFLIINKTIRFFESSGVLWRRPSGPTISPFAYDNCLIQVGHAPHDAIRANLHVASRRTLFSPQHRCIPSVSACKACPTSRAV